MNSFDSFCQTQSTLSNKAKGDAFEQLVHTYFKLDPKYAFYDDVWLFSKVPNVVLEELGLPSQDIGIDLIAKTGYEYHAIQCKFHQDNTQSVTFNVKNALADHPKTEHANHLKSYDFRELL